MLQRFLFGIILTASVGLVVSVGMQRGPLERRRIDKLSSPPMANWTNNAVTIATLGHRGLYEDFSTIWIIQLLADHEIKTYADAEKVYKAIIPGLRQLPKIEAIYLLGCFVLSLEFDRPEYCEEISLLGLKALPDSWRIPMVQGFIANFKMGQKGRAAAYYALASTRPQAPEYVKRLAHKLATAPESSVEDLNSTFETFKEIPGGTKLLELLRPQFKDLAPAPMQDTPTPSPEPSEIDQNQSPETAQPEEARL